MTIRNTTADDPLVKFFDIACGGGIEAQEARGQRELAASSQLPTDMTGDVHAMLTEAGAVFWETGASDPLFQDVTLPEGWKIAPTDHSMWSDLVDAAGVKRASIFYKAAFYDRCAFIH